MSTDPTTSRLQPGDGTEDSTQRGCTTWLLISCVALTLTTSFVFGWGLAAPNMYNDFTEPFLNGRNGCSVKNISEIQAKDTTLKPILAESSSTSDVSLTNNDVQSTGDESDGAVTEKSRKHKENKKKFSFMTELLKGFPQTVYLIGAFIGAITGPLWPKYFDRKRTVFFNYIFCFGSSLSMLLSYYLTMPMLFYLSRILLGYQGGMGCVIVPPFIGEISSQKVRGAAGAGFQLSLTIGILVSQIVGLPSIAGTCERWGWGLGIVFLLPMAGVFVLFILPNSPTQMIGKYNNEEQATADLRKLRGMNNVEADLDIIREQTTQSNGGKSQSLMIPQIIKTKRYFWPMLTTVVLQTAQALSGINAVFFYSSKMFETAGIAKENIPYANIGTGLINVIATIVSIPLIEKLGRRPLVLYPMFVMVGVFAILTGLVEFNEKLNYQILGLLSVVFILIFIVCFAVGLGPIPFLYGSEVCRPEVRDSVQSLGLVCNYIGNILLSLFFPVLNAYLGGYVFLIFMVLVLGNAIFLWKKMPETKNKTVEDAEKFWKVNESAPAENLLSKAPATA